MPPLLSPAPPGDESSSNDTISSKSALKQFLTERLGREQHLGDKVESGGREKEGGVTKEEEDKEGVVKSGEEEGKVKKEEGKEEGAEGDQAAEGEHKLRRDKAEKDLKVANGSRVDGSQNAGVAGHQQNGFARPPAGMDPRWGYMPSPMHSYGPQPTMEGQGAQNGMNMPYAMPPPYGYYGDRMSYYPHHPNQGTF